MTLSETALNALIARPEVVREFPVLLTTARPVRRCCGRPARPHVDYNAIRASLAGMPDDRKQLFKRLAGLERCRLIFRQHNKVVDITF